MFYSSSKILFFIMVLLSIIITSSSSNHLFMWMGLELSTLSFIPLIFHEKNKNESEAAIKYFLTQALASIMYLTSIILLISYPLLSKTFMISALMIKLGAAPYHSWLPSTAEGMNWTNTFILLTLQKANPLIILTSINWNNFMFIFICSSAIFGSLGGWAYLNMKTMMAFSSISHMSWMLSTLLMSTKLLSIYFTMYIILFFPIMLLSKKFNITHINQTNYISLKPQLLLPLFLLLLSLGGLPPFLGFLPKWLIIESLATLHPSLLTLLVFSSLLTLYFYLRIMFNALILTTSTLPLHKSQLLKPLELLSITPSLLGLSLTFILI